MSRELETHAGEAAAADDVVGAARDDATMPAAEKGDRRAALEQIGRWALVAPNGRETRLTRSEHAVLAILIGRAGEIQPRNLLRAAISGDPRRERVLDAVLSRLRRKVWDCARSELPLRSARDEGYVFAGAVEPGSLTDLATDARLN